MKPTERLTFKFAAEAHEFEQIHRLNYRTFVEEIPQHERNPDGLLVDKFHTENLYAICLDGDRLVGMVAGRVQRPFSLDGKLPNLDSYLPTDSRPCEIRLLAVEPEYRRGAVFWGLVRLIGNRFREQGHNLAVISGTVRQLKLYRHMGFVPFGPLVGTEAAPYQPMYLTLERFNETTQTPAEKSTDSIESRVNFLPGPVAIHSQVREAFSRDPFSHRSRAFAQLLAATRQALCRLVGAPQVEILVGSGSLANDVVAGQISQLHAPGVILANGEFGERLVDHARRFGLEFEVLRQSWGQALDSEAIRQYTDHHPGVRWLWMVHCETSTGMVNDLDFVRSLGFEKGLKICADCISSIGTFPVSLKGIYLASGASGKGLGSYPGLSLVWYDHPLTPEPERLPRYQDLGFYASQQGIPFTHSSNLVEALYVAVRRVDWLEKFQRIRELSTWLRDELRRLDFVMVGDELRMSPAVITLALPETVSSRALGWWLERTGFLVSYRSDYLLNNNWIQICLMGECSQQQLVRFMERLRHYETVQNKELALRETIPPSPPTGLAVEV
jgi:aspartate aminotransferase-like enzyme